MEEGRQATVSIESVAEELLAGAKRAGATAADVVVAEGDSLEVGVRLGEIEKLQQSRSRHLGLRVFVGDRSALSSSSDFSPETLARLAEETCALARVMAADPDGGLPDASLLARSWPDLDLHDPAVAELGAETAIEMALAAEGAARAADPRITNSEGAECGASTSRAVYASSTGFLGSYRDSGVSLSVVPVATENGAMQRDYWFSAGRHLAGLESPESIGRTAAARTLRRLGARSVRTGEYPVVFDPRMAAGLLGHLAGAVSGYSVYKGTTFLADRMGQRIAPGFFTVVDDGRLPGQPGSKPFDGEGLPTRRTVVVEDGILRSWLLDSYAGRKLGLPSTGSAGRSVASAPFVSTTNFRLAPGTATPEEIIGSVKAGLYVTEMIGFGVNGTTGDYSRGAVGLWIENGELTHAVEGITIAGNLLAMYDAIEVLGNDPDLRRALSAPTLKVARMTVAGE